MGHNYSFIYVGTLKEYLATKGRIMLGEALELTGSEVSINYLHAGTYIPFVHSHKLNEEVYIILSGNGMLKVDDEEFRITEGSMIRVSPKGERAIKADDDMTFICIQAQEGSLTQATREDGIINESKASWMKNE